MKETEITMQVSAGTKKQGKRQLYVLYTRGRDMAEIRLPDYRLMQSRGFTQEEVGQLTEYTKRSEADILAMSKEIDPIKAMMR